MTDGGGLLHFKVDARILSQLGEELVANRTTALAELVKNAYDADATRVTVHFIDPARGGTLEIRDDGEGMDLVTIRDHWMRLSTGNKDRNPISPRYQRIRGGKKGIGRFAAHSLGKRLVLSTTTEGSPERIVATFEWAKFERTSGEDEDETSKNKEEGPEDQGEKAEHETGILLEQIGSPYEIVPAPPEEKGTVLLIEGLRTAWGDDTELKKLRRALQLLQPPFPLAEVYRPDSAFTVVSPDPGFELKILVRGSPEHDDAGIGSPSETERFLDAATAIVEAEVADDGIATWRVHSDRFPLTEEAEYPTKLFLTGEFSLKASYFIHKRDAIGDLSVKTARDMGKDYGGIRIYRDGLRVPPYGDPTEDWIHLDELARQREVLYPIANNNWFGHVSISREHNVCLIDTASREGVLENEAFEELKTFVRDVLVDCGRRVARIRGKKERARRRELPVPESRKALVERTLEVARQAVDLATAGRLDEARAVLDRASSAIFMEARSSDASAKRHEASLLEEIDLLRILSSLGTSIVVFSHEVQAAIQTTTARLIDIAEDAEEAPEPWKSFAEEGVEKATLAVGRLRDLAQFIEGYTSRSRRRERKAQPLHAVLDEFTAAFRRLVERRSAKMDWWVRPESLRTRTMARSELEAILVNLLTNALKHFKGTQDRRILVTAEQEDGGILLRFQDSGNGVAEEVRETLFEPFVTTSIASDSDLGLGTGLGLKIVQDIAQANRGGVVLGQADENFVTCFEIRLPRARTGEDGNE